MEGNKVNIWKRQIVSNFNIEMSGKNKSQQDLLAPSYLDIFIATKKFLLSCYFSMVDNCLFEEILLRERTRWLWIECVKNNNNGGGGGIDNHGERKQIKKNKSQIP